MPVEREWRRALRPFTERSCVCRIVAEPEVDAGMSAEHSGGPRPDVPYSAGKRGALPYQTCPSGNFRTGRWCSVPQTGACCTVTGGMNDRFEGRRFPAKSDGPGAAEGAGAGKTRSWAGERVRKKERPRTLLPLKKSLNFKTKLNGSENVYGVNVFSCVFSCNFSARKYRQKGREMAKNPHKRRGAESGRRCFPVVFSPARFPWASGRGLRSFAIFAENGKSRLRTAKRR